MMLVHTHPCTFTDAHNNFVLTNHSLGCMHERHGRYGLRGDAFCDQTSMEDRGELMSHFGYVAHSHFRDLLEPRWSSSRRMLCS